MEGLDYQIRNRRVAANIMESHVIFTRMVIVGPPSQSSSTRNIAINNQLRKLEMDGPLLY